MPLNLRLPSKGEAALIGAALVVLLFVSWLRRGERIAVLEQAVAAKPRVEFRDRIVEKRVVVKGPVRVVKVEAPDGTKTTTVDRAAETISTDKDRDVARSETPVCAPPRPAKTRVAGVLFGPHGFGGSWVEGGRLGLTFVDTWDLAARVQRMPSGSVGVGADASFRW